MTTNDAPVIEIRRVTDFSALAGDWRDLEQRSEGSFFQSWAWTGCLAEERFADPWVMSGRRYGKLVVLALFNRGPRAGLRAGGPLAGRPLLLGESGNPDQDTIFIEHNGLLIDKTEPAELARSCWAALAAHRESGIGRAQWILSGIPRPVCDTLPMEKRLRILVTRPAPYVDFFALQPSDDGIPGHLSANARQQLRRSLRAWEKIGPLRLDVAAIPDEAGRFLDALKDLHQQYWSGRGKPGAFAQPFFERFHRTLIGRMSSDMAVDLIRISAGDRVIGYLHNLVYRKWVAAYQSGFAFGPEAEQLRPGLVCHLQAIAHYRGAGMGQYDFLGGEARYKRSFANADRELLWVKLRNRSAWRT